MGGDAREREGSDEQNENNRERYLSLDKDKVDKFMTFIDSIDFRCDKPQCCYRTTSSR